MQVTAIISILPRTSMHLQIHTILYNVQTAIVLIKAEFDSMKAERQANFNSKTHSNFLIDVVFQTCSKN